MSFGQFQPSLRACFLAITACLPVVLLTDELWASSGNRCVFVDVVDWESQKQQWRGREVVGFASWCSSCKHKIQSTKAEPSKYIFFSVFEDPEQSAEALGRLGLASPCIYGDKLGRKLGIKSLPWSGQL